MQTIPIIGITPSISSSTSTSPSLATTLIPASNIVTNPNPDISVKEQKEKEPKNARSVDPKRVKQLITEDCLCPVCQEMAVDPVSSACGHILCNCCYLELKQHNSRPKCPLCAKQMGPNALSVNLILSRILTEFGGRSYQKRVKKVNELKKQQTIIKDYLSCTRGELLSSMIEGYLFFGNDDTDDEEESENVVDPEKRICMKYSDVLANFNTYDKEEIDLVLINRVKEGEVIIHGDTLVNPMHFLEYIIGLDFSNIGIDILVCYTDWVIHHGSNTDLRKCVTSAIKRKISKPGFHFKQEDLNLEKTGGIVGAGGVVEVGGGGGAGGAVGAGGVEDRSNVEDSSDVAFPEKAKRIKTENTNSTKISTTNTSTSSNANSSTSTSLSTSLSTSTSTSTNNINTNTNIGMSTNINSTRKVHIFSQYMDLIDQSELHNVDRAARKSLISKLLHHQSLCMIEEDIEEYTTAENVREPKCKCEICATKIREYKEKMEKEKADKEKRRRRIKSKGKGKGRAVRRSPSRRNRQQESIQDSNQESEQEMFQI